MSKNTDPAASENSHERVKNRLVECGFSKPISDSIEVIEIDAELAPAPEELHPAAPVAAYLASLSTMASRRGMVSAIRAAAEVMSGQRDWRRVDWRKLNAALVAAVLSKVEGSPATKNKTLSALKGVARAAFRFGVLSADDFARIKDVDGVRGSRLPAGRDVAPGEITALMRCCCDDPRPAGARDAAMIALAASTGARRAEIASLLLSDIEEEQDGGRFAIRVIGKGDKERTFYAGNGAAAALADWSSVRGDTPGALFCRVNKGSVLFPDEGISVTAMDGILKRRVVAAGVPALTWHDLRRTVTGELLDAGVDVVTVAGMLGHASVETTARYDRRGERAKRAAAGSIVVPYFGR